MKTLNGFRSLEIFLSSTKYRVFLVSEAYVRVSGIVGRTILTASAVESLNEVGCKARHQVTGRGTGLTDMSKKPMFNLCV